MLGLLSIAWCQRCPHDESFYTSHCTLETFDSKQFLQQTQVPSTASSSQFLHRTPFTSNTFCIWKNYTTYCTFYSKTVFTPGSFSPNGFTPDTLFTKHFLHQTVFTPRTCHTKIFDTKQLLHQRTFAPEQFLLEAACTKQFFSARLIVTRKNSLPRWVKVGIKQRMLRSWLGVFIASFYHAEECGAYWCVIEIVIRQAGAPSIATPKLGQPLHCVLELHFYLVTNSKICLDG